MTQTLCCATPHRTHSYHIAPNTLCGFFIPPVKQLFISPSLPSLSPSLPHTCFIFTPTPTSLRLIVSITLLCLHEYFNGFVFLKKNTILHIAYCIHASIYYILAASVSAKTFQRITARSEVSGRDVQFKQDQSTKGVCHICPLCRAALTASDDSFHQWHWSV